MYNNWSESLRFLFFLLLGPGLFFFCGFRHTVVADIYVYFYYTQHLVQMSSIQKFEIVFNVKSENKKGFENKI